MAVYQVIPLDGRFTEKFTFQTDDFPAGSKTYEVEDLWQFASGQVMNVGALAVHGNVVALKVLVVTDDRPSLHMWMMVDTPFHPKGFSLVMQDAAGDAFSALAEWYSCADFASAWGETFMRDNAEDFANIDAEYREEAIILNLQESFFGTQSGAPWGDQLFARCRPMPGWDPRDPDRTVLMGHEVTFMDGTVRYLTPQGVMTSFDFGPMEQDVPEAPEPDSVEMEGAENTIH